MRRPDPNVFPTLLCAAIFVAGAGGVAAGTHLQRVSGGNENRASWSLPAILMADAQPSYRFVDDQPKLEPALPPSIAAPKFSRIIIEKTGVSRLEGSGTPGSQVLINSAGRMIAAAVVDAEGRWAVTLDKDLEAGDHAITSVAAGGDTTLAGDEVRVFIPSDFAGREIVAYDRARPVQTSLETGRLTQDEATAQRAQELAAAATERFSEVVPPRDQPAAAPEASAPRRNGIDIATPVAGWFERASQIYKNEVSGKLTVPVDAESTSVQVAQNSDALDAPATNPDPAAAVEQSTVTDFLSSGATAVQQWMRQSGETYDREIAGPLSVPTGTDTAAAPPAGEEQPAKDAQSARDEPRIKQSRPSVDTSGPPAEAAHKIQMERERAAKALREAEERDRADAAEQTEDAKRRQAEDASARNRDEERAAADQARKAAEAKKIVEGMKRLEAAQRAEERHKKKEAAVIETPRAEAKPAARAPEVAAAPEAEDDAKPAKRLEFTIEDGNVRTGQESGDEAREDDSDLRELTQSERVGRTKRLRQALIEDKRRMGSDTGSRIGGWRASDESDARRARSCQAGSLRRHGRKMVYIVQPGDTLWAIAGRHYKHGGRYNIIYRANQRRLSSADLIHPCQRLVLPLHGRKRHG